MAKLIGNAPNQVPTNADLGSMAFEDRTNYITKGASVHQPYRNIIINGDMSIAQRGTSVSGINSFGYYTVDRWQFGTNSFGGFTMSQDTDVPTGQGFAYSTKIDCTTAKTPLSAGDNCQFFTKFEGQMLQYLKKGTANAESLTLSFWVKSNKTGTYIAELYDDDNNRQISKSYTIDASNTWEKKTLIYDGDTTGAFNNDNNISLTLRLWLASGSTFSSGTLSTTWTSLVQSNRAAGQVNLADSTSNDFWITGVQLEAGTTASDFEFLPYDVNLKRCKRYYYTYVNGIDQSIGIGVGYNNNKVYSHVNFQVEMRAVPSIITSNNTNDFRSRKANIDTFDTWDGIQTQTKNQSIPFSSAQVAIATGEAVWVETNQATALLAFNSEL